MRLFGTFTVYPKTEKNSSGNETTALTSLRKKFGNLGDDDKRC